MKRNSEPLQGALGRRLILWDHPFQAMERSLNDETDLYPSSRLLSAACLLSLALLREPFPIPASTMAIIPLLPLYTPNNKGTLMCHKPQGRECRGICLQGTVNPGGLSNN